MFASWKRNVLFETAVLFAERWRHLTYSNEPNFINNVLLVAKFIIYRPVDRYMFLTAAEGM